MGATRCFVGIALLIGWVAGCGGDSQEARTPTHHSPSEPILHPTTMANPPASPSWPAALPEGAVLDDGPGFLERPARIQVHGTVARTERVPLLIFLPPTNGTGEEFYERVASVIELPGYVQLLPQGRPGRGDYLPHFREFLDAYEARLAADIERAIEQFPVDRERIFVSGFSLGGDLSWAMLMRRPDLFRGALMVGSRCSVRPRGDTLTTLRDRDGRALFAIATGDQRARVEGMQRSHQRIVDAGIPTQLMRYPGAHVGPDEAGYRALYAALLR